VISDAVSIPLGNLRDMTARSINCAYGRLSQIVGLNRVVDTTYRMASSDYLRIGQPASEHRPIEPFASFATGANEMSPLDMASGAQTIANEGVHLEPYYVEHVDQANGDRLYTHEPNPLQILDRGVALTAVDIMKGTLEYGTARNWGLDNGWAAAGKTGTQQDNTNAWFVGFTTVLTTSVWIGDPDAYTPMRNIPEFAGSNENRVQGGRYPAEIWNAYMNAAHANQAPVDWEAPPEPSREPMRLYLPGNECLVRVVGFQPGEVIGREPGGTPGGPRAGGFRVATPPVPTTVAPEPPAPTTVAPATTAPTATTATTAPAATTVATVAPPPVQTAPPVVITAPPRPVYERVEGGTTIPANVLDPRAPIPTTPQGNSVVSC
jgi:penicillin-binding protein 1A